MSLFSDSDYPVREDLAKVHEAQVKAMGAPGTWGTGAQRLAIAAEARQAGYDAGILEEPIEAGAAPEIKLPEVARKVVRRLAVALRRRPETLHRSRHEPGTRRAAQTCGAGTSSIPAHQ